MSQSLGLIKVEFNLPETSVQTQCIVLQGQVPTKLNFEFMISASDLDSLNFRPSQTTLSGLIYEFPLAEQEIKHLIYQFHVSQCEFIFFSDESKNNNSFYAIALNKEPPASRNSFQTAIFFLFECNKHEIFLNDTNYHEILIRILKKNKHIFIQNALNKYKELEALTEETSSLDEILEFLTRREKYLVEEIENAKQGVKQIEYQVNKKRVQLEERKTIDFNCKSCIFGQKSSAFIPCGHSLYCSTCTIQFFNSKSEKICDVCQVAIEDYNFYKLI